MLNRGSVRYFLGRDLVNASYRFYSDDWGIDSHTLDLRYRWNLNKQYYLQPWRVGIENPEMQDVASGKLEISNGALATSGDSRRFLLKNGKRYSHILNPKTGYPVIDAPRSITVAAATTIEAGMLATFASLQGRNAESYLQEQQVQFWVLR